MPLRTPLPPLSGLVSGLLAVLVAGCIPPPPAPPDYMPPATGTVVTFAETADGAKAAGPSLRIRVLRSIDDRILNEVTPLPSGKPRQVRNLRGLVAYQVWHPGERVFVDDVSKNPVRDLWPLTPKNWSETNGSLYIGRGSTEKVALKNVSKTGSVKMAFDVLRREEVKVPAGTYQAIVIRRVATTHNLDGSVRRTTERLYWFVPSIGWPVRIDTITRQPGAPDSKTSMVALSVERPPAAR